MPPQSAQTDPYASIAAPAPAAQADPYAAIAVPIPPKQGSVVDRSIQGAKDFAAPIADLMKPPETPTEQVVHAVGGGGGALAAYRIAKNLVATVDNAVKSTPGEYADAAKNVVRAVQDFHNKDYRNALADAVSAGSTLAPTVVPGGQDTRDLANGIRPGGDLARPLVKQALTAGTVLAGGEALGPEEEAANAATSRLKVNPFRQIAKGADVAQPAAKAAVTDAAAAAAKDSGVTAAPTNSFRTAADETISKTAKAERAQYDRINQAAGTDLKSLYEREGELQDALDDPSNIVQKPAIQVELQRTQMQIANGESKASESGIDAQKAVRQAKDLTQQRFAVQDFKSKVLNNESVIEGNQAAGAEEKINIPNAIKAVERMDKPSRYAPEGTPTRLQQALGKDGATAFKQSLYDAQKLGESAVSKQQMLSNIVKTAKILGLAGGSLVGLYEIFKH